MFLAGFDSGKVSALADEAQHAVPAGLLKCGVRQFEARDYTARSRTWPPSSTRTRGPKDAGYADASSSPRESPCSTREAGVQLPSLNEPEGPSH